MLSFNVQWKINNLEIDKNNKTFYYSELNLCKKLIFYELMMKFVFDESIDQYISKM